MWSGSSHLHPTQPTGRQDTYPLLCAELCAQSLQCSLPVPPVLQTVALITCIHTQQHTHRPTCTRGLSECHIVRYSPFHSLSISNSSNAIQQTVVATDMEDIKECLNWVWEHFWGPGYAHLPFGSADREAIHCFSFFSALLRTLGSLLARRRAKRTSTDCITLRSN